MRLRTLNRLRRAWLGRGVAVWYHPQYRLPIAGVESHMGMEPRRADFAAWYLVDRRVVPSSAVRVSRPATYEELSLVHTPEWLEGLTRPDELAAVFSLRPGELEVDEVMNVFRLATGGTIDAARWAVSSKKPALNLLGGFHHAGPAFGGGFCPINDIAVAVACLRRAGWKGTVAVLDLDAHPSDGTAACFKGDSSVWQASLSGADWGPLPEVDETVLPSGTGDDAYLSALERTLSRMPRADLAFVIAGGDVLAGDRFGALGLTLDGVRRRDLAVARVLDGIGSVWVPGGGYSHQSWRVLAGTALALALRTRHPIAPHYDPLQARFARIATSLDPRELGGDPDELSFADLAGALGLRSEKRQMLDYYSAQGVEQALWRYGVLEQLGRLGYRNLRVVVDAVDQGDRLRVFAENEGIEHLLVECVLEKRRVADRSVLFIHWLTLRHPRAAFAEDRPRLPGQDAPGLGMARESSEMLLQMAQRLDLDGVAFRPAWYHMAFAARSRFQFVDTARQARFEALQRDLSLLPLVEATVAVSEGRVLLDGKPYVWEADDMLFLTGGDGHTTDADEVARLRDEIHFTVVPK